MPWVDAERWGAVVWKAHLQGNLVCNLLTTLSSRQLFLPFAGSSHEVRWFSFIGGPWCPGAYWSCPGAEPLDLQNQETGGTDRPFLSEKLEAPIGEGEYSEHPTPSQRSRFHNIQTAVTRVRLFLSATVPVLWCDAEGVVPKGSDQCRQFLIL